MSSAVEFVKQEILDHFAESKADAGHVLNDRSFYHQRMMHWNPKQKDALDMAIDQLIAAGLAEKKDKALVLTAKGVDSIYPDPGQSVRGAVLEFFADARARAGDAFNVQAFHHQHMIHWNPKQKKALDPAVASLVADGLVEYRNGTLFLTDKGVDEIY